MAVVKIGRQVYNGVAKVSIIDSDDKDMGVVKIVRFTGAIESIPFKKCKSLRVECKSDKQLQRLECQNCAIIIGNVEYAKVTNCMNVEGNIKQVTKCGNRISTEKYLKVLYGSALRNKEKIMKGVRSKVIHIDGHLLSYKVTITGQSIENVIIGDVNEVQVGNCLNVKGTVRNCVVGNCIKCSSEVRE